MKKYEITSTELRTWTNHPKTNGFTIEWQCKGIGFGELTFYVGSDGKGWQCETECMSKKFIDAVLKHFFDTQIKYVDK